MLTEIWPAYSDQIYGTWRETKSFKRLRKKDPTCHESDRSIQEQGIGLVKPADDGGMCVVHCKHGVDLNVLSCKATAVVATKLQTLCAKLDTYYFIWELLVKDTSAFKVTVQVWF